MQRVVVIGGCGRVGLPLAISLAEVGFLVTSFDVDYKKVSKVNNGIMPFLELEASQKLNKVIKGKKFKATSKPECIKNAKFVISIIGTPIDEFLNPNPELILNNIKEYKNFLNKNQILILRSTIFPGVTKSVENWVEKNVPGLKVAFCPERIAEGKAFEELRNLPQIIGARNEKVASEVSELFKGLTKSLIFTSPEVAELAKLFTNAWRYINFATVNQFYMIANDYNIDFNEVRNAIITEYPRAYNFPKAGFSAGPCLVKDTMQLAAFSKNIFTLGHEAMLINEGLPKYIIQRLEYKYDLNTFTVGILGMTFKSDIDDNRSSLSYKLKKILKFKAKKVMCSDPYLKDSKFVSVNQIITKCDLIIIATPHSEYKDLIFQQPVIDVWNLLNKGILI